MKTFFKVCYVMRYYFLTIILIVFCLCLADIFLFNGFHDLSPLQVIGFIALTGLLAIFIDGMLALIVHHLPEKWFDPYLKYLKVSKREKKFFDFIKIKKWKDKIPEIGALTCDFGKDKLANPNDVSYIYKFLIETGYAEVIHISSCIFGFLPIFILPLRYALFIGIPVGIINIAFNILSALIQRYNRPKLLIVYERQKRLKERNEQKLN